MISAVLARRLRDAGVRWDPAPGDRFFVDGPEMNDEVFTLSEMTVEMHDFPGGRVIGFNGTVEWALDAVEARHSVWLPAEGQLRDLLAGTFRRLVPVAEGWQVTIEVAGREVVTEHADAAEAYGLALLELVDATR